jgi:hypothetical protein
VLVCLVPKAEHLQGGWRLEWVDAQAQWASDLPGAWHWGPYEALSAQPRSLHLKTCKGHYTLPALPSQISDILPHFSGLSSPGQNKVKA